MVLVIPFLLTADLRSGRLRPNLSLPLLQIPIGALLFLIGLLLLLWTVRLFIRLGRGTLAPWDPTKALVIQGPYAHVRNPMIAGVLFMILAEAILLGSWRLLGWFLFFGLINTIYFRLSEEPGLVTRFGRQYTAYRANVPMWIPRLRAWHPQKQNGK
jgi:protein-S-isoprenylcysteine O-methyltransferase Ste14